MDFRIENDFLGQKSISNQVYWGIHTQRALENFGYGIQSVPQGLIRALAKVKKACCQANLDLGYLSSDIAEPILMVCDEIINGKLMDQFPLNGLQGGAGTSVNMNMNEVIANRVLEIMGIEKGEYEHCHPIEHVNLHQSTNDVYPTALKIAAIEAIRNLSKNIAEFQAQLQKKEKQFGSDIVIGRTQLQEAVPITLGAQFSTYADAIARDRWRTFKSEERLRVVNIGGTAAGTGLTAPRSYIFLAIEKLREVTGYGVTRGDNLMDQTANADVFAEVSGILGAHAVNLEKISNDLRLYNLLSELKLPAVQTGSSIMPGKVNPVIPEAIISSSIKVSANNKIISDCAARGSFQINEFLPLIALSLLESVTLLSNSDKMLTEYVKNIEANSVNCEKHTSSSTTLITAFLPYIGYKKAESLVDEFNNLVDIEFREFLAKKLGAQLVNRILSPEEIMALGYKENDMKEFLKE
ncbi:MAG: aspartate ammonia-lyase [Fibrobacter sp.]|nr:aspartate ammonia-lyase [Fibrobacter sp.]